MTDTTNTSTTTSTDTDTDTGALAATGPAAAAPGAQGPRMEQIDPSLLLVDRNVRRDAAPDKTLIESVRDLGVLIPIVAVRTDAGIRVRYGHRRAHAAIQAGQATVPVWVFDTDHDGSDTDRIVAQWAENEHRAALTDTDRLAAVEQLSAFGVSAAQITRRLKTKRTQVDAALAVAASPQAKKSTERYEFLTLDQAAVLAEFDAGDDADTVKALVAAAKDSPGQFAHVAQRARDDRAARAREQAARDAIAASGVTVLSGPAPSRYGPAGGPERLLADLTAPGGEPLTPAGHAACPGTPPTWPSSTATGPPSRPPPSGSPTPTGNQPVRPWATTSTTTATEPTARTAATWATPRTTLRVKATGSGSRGPPGTPPPTSAPTTPPTGTCCAGPLRPAARRQHRPATPKPPNTRKRPGPNASGSSTTRPGPVPRRCAENGSPPF